jgi:hypothetical protein
MQKILDYIKNNSVTITTNMMLALFIIICIISIKQIIDNYKNPPALKEYSGIQNHLVWSVKGECYFVRPHNDYTNYLVRTEDCDKK